jgi:plastocyanin
MNANQKKVNQIKKNQESLARRKSLEERLAAQRAAELAKKRKKFIIIGGAVAALAAVIVLIVIFAGGAGGGSSDGVRTVTTTMTVNGSSDISVKAGTPVKWTIKGGSGNLGCMDGVRSSLFEFRSVKSGQNTTVSFTPQNAGSYTVYCSHGVRVCTITVT